eukprot:9477472-Pyramimonas_sp.AAC.5
MAALDKNIRITNDSLRKISSELKGDPYADEEADSKECTRLLAEKTDAIAIMTENVRYLSCPLLRPLCLAPCPTNRSRSPAPTAWYDASRQFLFPENSGAGNFCGFREERDAQT